MGVPIVCVNARIWQFAFAFADLQPSQHRHFVIVLVGLLLCHGSHTLIGVLRSVRAKISLAALSRFLAEVPWKATDVTQTW